MEEEELRAVHAGGGVIAALLGQEDLQVMLVLRVQQASKARKAQQESRVSKANEERQVHRRVFKDLKARKEKWVLMDRALTTVQYKRWSNLRCPKPI